MENQNIAHLPNIFARKVMSASGERKGDIQIQATIFRVPDNIRTTSADSFEPKIVSLGPYHHEKLHLRASDERIKLPYAHNFFRRIIGKDTNLEQHVFERFTDLAQNIFERFWKLESNSRRAYSEELSMTSIEFLEMMMLDCIFMAEFLLLQREINNSRGAEMVDAWKWAAPLIVNDMLILENQVPLLLPYQVLTESIKSTETSAQFFFTDFILQIHKNLSPTSKVSVSYSCLYNSHLLHLFHAWLVSKLGVEAREAGGLPSFPRAELLQAMRIQFANKTGCSSFLDITFNESKRSLEIPQLLIDDDNISLLRNLIAFEQQCHEVDSHISTYIWFMDCLINTDKDVAVLRKHKIIVSRLHSDEEVAHIFNALRRTNAPVVDFNHFYLAKVINNVESYARNMSNRLWALWNFSWLRQNYFKNRWVTIGVIAVVFFNLLTLVQTVFAVLSYAKQ